jgi:hypothetical protein
MNELKPKNVVYYKNPIFWAIIITVIAVVTVSSGLILNFNAKAKYKLANEAISSNVYKNTEYGFHFTLPESWKGYTKVTDDWKDLAQGNSQSEIPSSLASTYLKPINSLAIPSISNMYQIRSFFTFNQASFLLEC